MRQLRMHTHAGLSAKSLQGATHPMHARHPLAGCTVLHPETRIFPGMSLAFPFWALISRSSCELTCCRAGPDQTEHFWACRPFYLKKCVYQRLFCVLEQLFN
jgi:hypothetical protein